MYSPCFDCFNRYGKQYTEECDNTCAYAKAVKDNKKILYSRVNDFITYVDRAMNDRNHKNNVWIDEKGEETITDVVCAEKWWNDCMKPELYRVFGDFNSKKCKIQPIMACIICDTKDEAKEFIHRLGFTTFENDFIIFYWRKPYKMCKNRRWNIIYTTKEVLESEWFKTVVRPYGCGGLGVIGGKEEG